MEMINFIIVTIELKFFSRIPIFLEENSTLLQVYSLE